MECFEYKIMFISTWRTDASSRMERILNFEGAKGWEICGIEFGSQNIEGDSGIRCIMKRPCQSVLTPYISLGFTENQLRQIYVALTGIIGETREQPLSTEALNYFLENAIDLFNEDCHALLHYRRRVINGMDYEKAITRLRELKEIDKHILEEP